PNSELPRPPPTSTPLGVEGLERLYIALVCGEQEGKRSNSKKLSTGEGENSVSGDGCDVGGSCGEPIARSRCLRRCLESRDAVPLAWRPCLYMVRRSQSRSAAGCVGGTNGGVRSEQMCLLVEAHDEEEL